MPGKKQETVTLDGQAFVVNALNIAELEELSAVMEGVSGLRLGIAILLVALRRATPPLDKDGFMALEATADELKGAAETIMRLSGMEAKPADPPNPPAV